MKKTSAPLSARRLTLALAAIALAALAVWGTSAREAQAQAPIVVRMATLVPDGSSWHLILKETAEKWRQLSGGRVSVRLFAGGVAGDDPDVVRKMRLGTLQAGVFTSVGVAEVDKSVYALGVPLMYDSYEEVYAVLEKMRPRIEAAMEKKGFVVLQWSRVGAMSLFCNAPYKTPAEMANAKVFAWEGDPKSVEAWRAAGFRPVVLSSTDIVPSLQTGMIDCVTNVPLYVLTSRLFEKANKMMDLPWGWILGATIVKKDAWEKIAPETRQKLQAIAVALGEKVDAEVRRLNVDAVAAMKKQGLQVIPVDAAPWRAAMEKSWSVVRGGVVPAEVFDEVKGARDACRAGAKKK